MLQSLKKRAVAIAVSVPFYTFGFATCGRLLELSSREIVIGLVAGAAMGVTMLVALWLQDRMEAIEDVPLTVPA